MDFLRRLAPPPRAGDRSRATPLLRSRFAEGAPLRSAPAVVDERPLVAEPDTAEAAAPVSAAVSLRPAVSDAAMAPARQAVAMPQASAADVPRIERSVAPRRPNAAANLAASDEPPPARSPAIAHRSSPARARADAVGVNDPASPQARFAPRAALPVARPLSQRAIDARVPVAAPMRPVIHVTIDRIDVRAPVAPPRAAEPAKPRHVAPSVPLADYLRAKVPT
jgi:hypothetical protein